MTHHKSILTILTLALLLACGQRGQDTSSETANDGSDKTIVLVNYKMADRATIARGIQTLNGCSPKIIGINALFIEPRDATGDSLLAQAMREGKNVVLASWGNFERRLSTEDSLISSNSVFTRSCLADGLIHFGYKDDGVSSHIPYRSVGDQLVWSYPITIASYFKMELASEFMSDFLGNTYYEIVFRKGIEDFRVLEIDKLDQVKCEDLENKIVLLGYLGPGNEDLLDTAAENERMYGTVIIANIILNLLDGDSIKQEDEVQDHEEKPLPTIATKHVL